MQRKVQQRGVAAVWEPGNRGAEAACGVRCWGACVYGGL